MKKFVRYNLSDPFLELERHFGSSLLPRDLLARTDLSDAEFSDLHSSYYHADPNHTYTWMPIRFTDPSKRHRLYATIVNRIDYLERLLTLLDASSPVWMTQMILEVQDRYQLLSIFMERKGMYSDEELLVDSESTPSPSKVLYPHQDKVFSVEELPDLTFEVMCCKFWGDPLNLPFDDPERVRMVGILSKALPSPCKGRSVTTILPDTWGDEPGEVVFDCMIRIIMGALLGVYDRCKVRANFRARRALYAWFCTMLPDKAAIGEWVKKNKYLIIYILREYTFYLIEFVPSLDHYMANHYYWHQMKKNASDAMDAVRSHVNAIMTAHSRGHPLCDWNLQGESVYEQYLAEGCFYDDVTRDAPVWYPGKSWFYGVASVLASYNKTNLDFCHRPIEASFLDMVTGVIRDIDDGRYANEEKKRIEQNFPKEWEDIIYRLILEGFNIEEPVTYHWLVLWFKVKLSTIKDLEEAERLYVRETSRSKILTVLKKLAENNPYDYHVLKLFFFAMEKKMSILFYDLPEYHTQKQIESYWKMYETLPGHPLDENAGCYYYCPNCGELKAKVVPSDAKVKSTKDRECTLHFERIAVNMITGERKCAKPASKSSPKKRSVSTDAVSEIMGAGPDARKESKKQSKDFRKRKTMEECRRTSLIKFCLIGKILRTEKWGLVIICPWCLCLTTLGRAAYKDSGGELSCGCMKLPQTFDAVKKVMMACKICGKQDEDHSLILVYDDVSSGPATLRYAPVCKKHGITHWIDKWDQVLRLSIIRQAIREGWTSIQVGDSGERIWIKKQKKFHPFPSASLNVL